MLKAVTYDVDVDVDVYYYEVLTEYAYMVQIDLVLVYSSIKLLARVWYFPQLDSILIWYM